MMSYSLTHWYRSSCSTCQFRHSTENRWIDRYSLIVLQVPDAMDCQQGHILLVFAPTRLLQVRAVVNGHVRPNHVPTATLTPVRELHLMSPARPLVSAGLVINRMLPSSLSNLTATQDSFQPERVSGALPHRQLSRRMLSPTNSGILAGSHSLQSSGGLRVSRMLSGGDDGADSDTRQLSGSWESPTEEWRNVAPMHCLLLRWGGLLTLVHLDTAHETHLLEVCFCSCPCALQHTVATLWLLYALVDS